MLATLVHGRAGVPIVWGLAFQRLDNFGLANVLPAVMASFGQASPQRHQATVMAGFCLSLFACGLISTWLASKFVTLPMPTSSADEAYSTTTWLCR